MHSFRLRYIALGLLIYIQSAFSRTSCGSMRRPIDVETSTPDDTIGYLSFDDVASEVFAASTVIEATAHRMRKIDGGHRQLDRFAVRFRVEKTFKGNIPSAAATTTTADDGAAAAARRRRAQPPTITVMTFGHRADERECVAPAVALQKRYIVFLRDSVSADDSGGGGGGHDRPHHATQNSDDGGAVFYISGDPIEATDANLAEVRRFVNCSKCTRSPTATLVPSEQTVKEGQRLSLQCRVTGKPRPQVFWFKDGVRLVGDRRVSIRSNKRGSQLKIRHVLSTDYGTYSCQAVNVIARSARPEANVTGKKFTVLCERQDYCFNGGTCRYMDKLQKQFCECTADFLGTRCEEKRTGLAGLTKKRKRRHHHQHQQQQQLNHDSTMLPNIDSNLRSG